MSMKVELERDVVTTITPPDGKSKIFIFDGTTTSGAIVSGSTSEAGVHLQPQYLEQITETVERSRGLLDGGFKIGFKLPESLGGFEFNLERKPREETRTIKKAIFMDKKKYEK